MTIDSNIVIGYLNEDRAIQSALSTFKAAGTVFLISTVSIAELLSFETLTDRDTARTIDFLEEHFLSVPVSSLIAQEAGRLRRQYGLKDRRGKP